MSVSGSRLYLFSQAQLAPQQRNAARAEQLRVDSVENPEAQMWIQIGLKNLLRSGFLELPAFSLPSVFNINELSVFWNFRFWSQNLEVESCCEHFHRFCHGYSGNRVEPSNYGALELTTPQQPACVAGRRENGTLLQNGWGWRPLGQCLGAGPVTSSMWFSISEHWFFIS